MSVARARSGVIQSMVRGGDFFEAGWLSIISIIGPSAAARVLPVPVGAWMRPLCWR